MKSTTNLEADESNVVYGIDYIQYIAPLIKGWQYHDQLIHELQEEIRQLKSKLKMNR